MRIDALLRFFASLVGPLLVLTSVSLAHADPERDDPAPLDDKTFRAWDHFELSMGFVAGQRRYTDTPWSLNQSGALPGTSAIVAPLRRAPYDNVSMFGVRYDARLVVSYVRMTVGFDLPFTASGLGAGDGRYTIGGVDRDVSVRSIGAKDLRFGIGGEYPFGPVAPFVDLIGGVHWASTTLAIDGQSHDYDATTFAFSLRGGARLHVRKWFFATASGEVGLVGDVRWGAELSVGFAFM
jgi:hypothetical protein